MSEVGNAFAGGRVERAPSPTLDLNSNFGKELETPGLIGFGVGPVEAVEASGFEEPQFPDLLFEAMNEAFRALEVTLAGDDFTAQRLALILSKGEVEDDRTALLLAVLQHDGPLSASVFLRLVEQLGHGQELLEAKAIRDELVAAGDVAVEAVSGVPAGALVETGPESELGMGLLDAVTDLDDPLESEEPEGWVSLSPSVNGEGEIPETHPEALGDGLPALPSSVAVPSAAVSFGAVASAEGTP